MIAKTFAVKEALFTSTVYYVPAFKEKEPNIMKLVNTSMLLCLVSCKLLVQTVESNQSKRKRRRYHKQILQHWPTKDTNEGHLELFDHGPRRNLGYCDSETVKFVEYDLPKRSLRSCIGGIVMGELPVHFLRRNLRYCDSKIVKFAQYDLLKRKPPAKFGKLRRNLCYCDSKIVKFAQYDLLKRKPPAKFGKLRQKTNTISLGHESRSEANSSVDYEFGGPSLHKDGEYLPPGSKCSI